MPQKVTTQVFQSGAAFNPGSTVALTQNASTLAAAANLARIEIYISNTSSSVVYLQLAATGAAASKGIQLNGNDTLVLTRYVGAISAFTASASVSLAIAEL
jgi:hypothetical protein